MSKALILTFVMVGFSLVGCSDPSSASDSSTPNTNVVGDLIAQAGASQMDSITMQVAKDSEEQYNIAKRQGDKMQICVQAMQVSAAYLQAKDEESYKKWKATEKADCAAAGMPDMG